MDVHIMAIAGGSCSGKTRLAKYTCEALGDKVCTILRQDNYYLDLGGGKAGQPLPNFDHPAAFDWPLLYADLQTLKSGQAVDIPTYDFTTHRRTSLTKPMEPKPILLVEGILLLSQEQLLPVFDHRFFVECPKNIRLDRRIRRDVAERGRTTACIQKQFTDDVAPMHEKFVEPSKINADVIIKQNQCTLKSIMHDGPLINMCRNYLSH